MSVTGKRKQLKQGIIKILSEWLMLEYYGDYEEVAADIMALVPKPEKCVMHKILSPANVMYFQCNKCDGIHFDIPDKFCPHCGRRVIATEDMQLWL
jgi:rubrerythrin